MRADLVGASQPASHGIAHQPPKFARRLLGRALSRADRRTCELPIWLDADAVARHFHEMCGRKSLDAGNQAVVGMGSLYQAARQGVLVDRLRNDAAAVQGAAERSKRETPSG